jgi:Trk-type K+ transport system membrane component
MLISTCMCTPIFINTFVVFIRLYWFEKRFQNVVIESHNARHNRTMSRRRSSMKSEHDRDLNHAERGVGDRQIRVMRTDDGQVEGGKIEDEHAFTDSLGNAGVRKTRPSDSVELDPLDRPMTPVHQITSNVAWADLTTPRDEQKRLREPVESPGDRLPAKNREQSIAFVEKQREPRQKATLRIPGPRDYELGLKPEEVAEENENLNRVTSRVSQESHPKRNRSNSVPPGALNGDDRPMKYHITIDVPNRPRPATGASVYNRERTTENPNSSGPNDGLRARTRSRTLGSFLTRDKDDEAAPMPYLSWTPTIGRNSNFVDLTEEQREELGGIEYRALKMLALILSIYFVGFHLLGMICLMPFGRYSSYKSVTDKVGVNPYWWGMFTSASMFNDLGFTLTPDSMISYQFAVLPLVLGTFLIIIGNTGFPCMLRFVIWLCHICMPKGSAKWEELQFLLDHPRRCFTLLFPSKANWWLFWVLIGLNGIDLIFFIILDLNDPTVISLPPGFRFLDGLFQAASTRTAGFAVVNIADLHPAIQVSYLIMMYISIFPIAMSMRQTNVYEEKSLGVWADHDDNDEKNSYLSHHLRRQLSFDLWFVFLGFFIIAIVEGSRLENTNEYSFSLFSVLFEIVSAYGTVGLSLGFPGVNTSFSGQFRTLSKLIIIAMQIRGRHRGLPYALDRAILLPSESLHQKENEDATRRARRGSNAFEMSMSTDVTGTNGVGIGNGLMRQGTGRSATTSERRGSAERSKPAQLKRILSGAFSAGPTTSWMGEKRA